MKTKLDKSSKKLSVEIPSDTGNLTNPYLNPFEKARVIAFRAFQITNGSKIEVDPGLLTDSRSIANLELEQRKIPVTIVRKGPDGTTREVNVNKLLHDIK